ncbi:hypothetical protein [Sulfurimonas paralvinellae]|uniref:Uncharacterized protein n=1 Tax=Sulfurimonas paralvinellae TaxID=317658 RepID=A0A7M1B8V3_9BACT|nr:hypothetical protein [Sulfurimonas paralvinellae]QOP45856.1 hypothetical protein FM071_05960 [Sulfurimonas paralvinellae]
MTKIVWKIYYWLILFVSIFVLGVFVFILATDINEFNSIFEGKRAFTNLYDIFFILLFFISVLGLRGFIYSKSYFIKELWKFIFFMMLVEYFGNIIYSFNDYDKLEYIIDSAVTLPILYALYQYVYKMNDLWKNNDD